VNEPNEYRINASRHLTPLLFSLGSAIRFTDKEYVGSNKEKYLY
jgi:hypothetical protein